MDEPTDTERSYLDAAARDDLDEADRLLKQIDTEQNRREKSLYRAERRRSAALWYANALGWPVFPCVVGDKRPATRHGFKDATTDLDRINRWWSAHPYNIATPTGITFDVVDIDGIGGQQLRTRFWDEAPPTKAWEVPPFGRIDTVAIGRVLTPSPGGLHIYIPPTGAGNTTRFLDGADYDDVSDSDGIDYRGIGGYVLLPPSVITDGGLRKYTWLGDGPRP